LPAEATIARADAVTCATRRNSSGKLVTMAANTARFDHDASGNPLGLLVEGVRQNKLTLSNASPTVTTGITVASGTATLSVVSDTTALTSAGLDLIGNNNVIRINNIGQATAAVINFSGTFGNTNAHSLSIYARVATAHTPTLTRSGTSPQSTNMDGGNTYRRYRLENITGHVATDTMRVSVPAGADVYVLLFQMEEGAFCSSEIINNGSAQTRQADRVRILNLNTYNWWNIAQGYMTVRYRTYYTSAAAADQVVISANDGTTNNAIGFRIERLAAKDLVPVIRSGGNIITLSSTAVPHYSGADYVAGISWRSDRVHLQGGGEARSATPGFAMPTGLTELSIGARNGAADPLFGWVRSIEIGRVYAEGIALGRRMYGPNDFQIGAAGQSLMGGHFASQASSSAGGRNRHFEIFAQNRPQSAVAMANGAVGATYASSIADPSVGDVDSWWLSESNQAGPLLTDFYTKMNNAGLRPNIILWAQGEADSLFINAGLTPVQYRAALDSIFAHMRSSFINCQICIQRIGRRASFSNPGGVQAVREIQQQIAADNPSWCFLVGETYDQPLFDVVHLTDAGYVTVGERNARKIVNVMGGSLPAVDGPRITSASRSGTSVTVTLAHDGGTDFTPTTGINGFSFFVGITPISISAAVRTNATTITLTLASTPGGGAETLYYGYDAMTSVSTNFVRDNTARSMPLQTTRINL
jgi:hypothetical protein